ncbi:hypothetical protein QFZ20_003626 [Flavobacterium sp. W4I14]|nr:hypothetical protein [Flavobacterium sp. W4I14]
MLLYNLFEDNIVKLSGHQNFSMQQVENKMVRGDTNYGKGIGLAKLIDDIP